MLHELPFMTPKAADFLWIAKGSNGCCVQSLLVSNIITVASYLGQQCSA